MKAAFTRAYNKEAHLTPYSLQAVKKGRRGGGGESELGGEDVDNEVQESEDEGEGLKTDAMIKVRACANLFKPTHTQYFQQPCQRLSSYLVLLCGLRLVLPCSKRRPKPPRSPRRRRRKILGRAKARGKARPRNDQ